MPEEETVVSQVTTGEGVKDGQPASDPGVVEPDPAAEQQVPYSRFKEINDAKNVAEQDAASLQTQVQTLQQQMTLLANQTVKQMPQQARDHFAAAGLEDGDYPTVQQIRQYKAEIDIQTRAQQAVSAADTFVAGKGDYDELVGLPDAMGNWKPSAFFTEVLKDDPSISRLMNDPRTARQIAYKAAKSYQRKQKLAELETTEEEREAQAKAELLTNPQTASSAGGGTGRDTKRLDANNPEDVKRVLHRAEQMREGAYDT